tara:strand:+ start:291 stop:695 length:405 start_codon:yes stop_codon:yes gene_type:complete
MGYRINDRNYTIADIFKEYFLDKYADFSTRTPRKQFLITSAFIYATIFITAVVDVFADTWSDELSIGIFSGIYILAMFCPLLALIVRRHRDINLSGWWCLLLIVPIVGPLWSIFIICKKGTDGANKFGSDPLAS